MCGIFGLASRNASSSNNCNLILDALAHRGPDGSGVYTGNGVMLGHTRLAIIDLNDAARQPMYSDDGGKTLVFNGEIYNYKELRSELVAKGHKFKTHSDTEVLLKSYIEWGVECVNHFRGMFAFVILDKDTNKIFLARDRCGEKPLIFFYDANTLAFASEYKALVGLLPKFPDIVPESVDLYLHYQYVPEPFSLLKGVQKLGAGQYAILDLSKWDFITQTYWSLNDVSPDSTITEDDIKGELEEAVRLTLRADVPVGLALSAGIDSGAIAAIASKYSGAQLHAFSVGYPNRPAYDERANARRLADKLRIQFHEVEIPTMEFVRQFQEFAMMLDEPIADPAAFGHYSVPKAAADFGVKVLLTGIGGDELFWGYDWTRHAVMLNENRNYYVTLGPVIRRLTSFGLASKILHKISRSRKVPMYLRHPLRLGLVAAYDETPRNQLVFMSASGAPEFTSIMHLGQGCYGDAMRDVTPENIYVPTRLDLIDEENLSVHVQDMLFKTWLVGNCLNLGDRVSMSVGVESRLPFLDYKLIEKVVARRKAFPDHQEGQKSVLRRILKGWLPEEVLNRNKAGFVPPVNQWLRGVIEKYSEQLYDGNLVKQGILDKDKLGTILKLESKHATIHTAYRLVLLETWYEGLRLLHCDFNKMAS